MISIKNYLNAFSFSIMFFVAGCGGGGSGGGTGGTATQSPKIAVSGTVSAPSGSSTTDLTVVSLGAKSSVTQQGNFTTQVNQDSVTIIAAMPRGKDFGLMNVVSSTSPSTSTAFVNQQARIKAANSSVSTNINLDSKTTAASLVFITPYLLTNDPSKATQILTVIENDPKVSILATVINSVYSSSDPLSDAGLKQALINAVQSVLNTLASQQSAAQQTTKSLSVISPPTRIVRLPKKSLSSALMAALTSVTSYYDDQDYIRVSSTLNGTAYDLTESSKNFGSLDWVSEVMKVDPAQFSSFADFQAKSLNNRYLFKNERAQVLGKLAAPAQSIFKYADLVSLACDYMFTSNGITTSKTVSVPSTADGIYLVRSYSGAWGGLVDASEKSFVRNQVPNGKFMDNLSMVDNVTLIALDTLSVFVDLKDLPIDKMVPVGLEVAGNEISEILAQTESPGIDQILSTVTDVYKAMFTEGAKDLLEQGIIGMFGKTAKIFGSSLIDVTGKISCGGKALDRAGQMLTSATPMESAIVVVGDPFAALVGDTVNPSGTGYSMSGIITIGSAQGLPLPGATVSIAGLTTTTSPTGTFSIAGIPTGTYAFSVFKSGYDTYTNPAYRVDSNQTGLIFYLTQQALANQVLVGAPTKGNTGSWYGMYSPYGMAASFTLASSTNVTTINILLRAPTTTNFNIFDFSLQNSLTGSITTFASASLTAPLGSVSTMVLNVNKSLQAGTYYLVGIVPGYFGTPVTAPGDVDGWLLSNGVYNNAFGTVTDGVWVFNGSSWNLEPGNYAPMFSVNGSPTTLL